MTNFIGPDSTEETLVDRRRSGRYSCLAGFLTRIKNVKKYTQSNDDKCQMRMIQVFFDFLFEPLFYDPFSSYFLFVSYFVDTVSREKAVPITCQATGFIPVFCG
jgi:hypothetical protein